MTKRAAIYVRVSTDKQSESVENQDRLLRQIAERRGWDVVDVYKDEGISGAKGRDKRPELDRLLKDATRRRIDVIAAWSVDRLGRSLQDLVGLLSEVSSVGCDLYLDQQAVDTTTPAGRAMFQMLGVFAEFERSVIVARVRQGIARARASGTKSGRAIGRPEIRDERVERVRASLAAGNGILRTARLCGVGVSVVQRLKLAA